MVDCTCQNSNFLKYIKELIEELKRSETVLFLEHYNFFKQAYITLKNNSCHSELVWQSEPKFLSSWTCFRILKILCEPVLMKCRILSTWSFYFQPVRSRNKFGMTFYFFLYFWNPKWIRTRKIVSIKGFWRFLKI